MKIQLTEIHDNFEVKNKGLKFEVRANDGTFCGNLYLTKRSLIWCKGKTARVNGAKIEWDQFIKCTDQWHTQS